MTRFMLCLSVTVLAAAHGVALAGTDKTDGVVVKVLQTLKRGASVLHVGSPVGAETSDIAIPTPNHLDSELMHLLLNAKPGTLLDVETNMVNGKPVLVSATAYNARPGEDEPNVYAFSKRTTFRRLGADVPAIDVTKFMKPTLLVLPVTRDKDGEVKPNADMLRTLDSLDDTDSVEVQTQTTPLKPGVFTLKSLKVYVPWERAQFSTLTKKKYQDNDYTALEVQPTDGEALQMLMSAKDKMVLTSVVNKMKHGDELLYRSKAGDDVTWVTEIKPVVVATQTPDKSTGDDAGSGTGSGALGIQYKSFRSYNRSGLTRIG